MKNRLKEGQIYTLNDGQTYDVIHRHFQDGSGSWCYDIVIMGDIVGKEGKIIMEGGGWFVDQEDCAISGIRERGVLVGRLGKTHEYKNGRLVEIRRFYGD